MGGCQTYGPFLDPYYNTAPNILGTQKGTIILTSTQMFRILLEHLVVFAPMLAPAPAPWVQSVRGKDCAQEGL